MSRFTQSSVCILIEGVGQADGAGNTGGILWCEAGMDSLDTLAVDGTTYDIEPRLLDVEGRNSSRSEPFRARATFAQYNFELDGTDDVAERFLGRPDNAVAEVASAIASTDTTADLDGTISTDTLYYINEETIKVTANNGGGNYDISRGLYGSPTQAHGKGANVFNRVPDWHNRKVTLFTYDRASDTLTERDWLRITKGNKQIDARVQIFTREVLQSIKELKLNRKPNVVKDHQLRLTAPPGVNASRPGQVLGQFQGSPRVRKSASLSADSDRSIWQIGDTLQIYLGGGRVGVDILETATRSELDYPSIGEPAKDLKQDLYECFVIDRDTDALITPTASSTKDLANVSTSVTIGGTAVTIEDPSIYPYHPLAIFGALALSDRSTTSDPDHFNVLQAPNWGANLRPYFSDDFVLRLHQMIQKTQWMRCDQEVFGADGKPVEFLRIIKRYLKAWGFDLGRDKNGRLDIYFTGLLDADDFAGALANKVAPTEAVHDWTDGAEDAISAIEVEYGGNPWRESNTISVSSTDNEEGRSQNLSTDADLTIDFGTIGPNNEAYIRDIVTARVLVQSVNIPRFRFRADDWVQTGGDYGLGARVMLQDLVLRKKWALDKSNKRVASFSDDIQFAGIIIGSGADWQENNWDLEVLVIGDTIIRKRAHAGVIAASGYTDNLDGTATFTLKPDSFGNANADASYFTTGDEVQVINPDGTTLEATEASVTLVSGNAVTVDATWTATPLENMILVPSFVDTDASGTGYFNDTIDANISRPWSALADTSGTLGDSGDDADQYGG